MTTDEPTGVIWVERLAQALAELATTQERYRDELDQIEREMSQWREFDDPSDAFALFDFYARACVGKGWYHAGEYGPLCNALAAVRSVLVAHPALAGVRSVLTVHPTWADLVNPPEPRDDIWIQILDNGYLGSLSSMIASLMARGREGPDDGFRRVAAELHGLLAPRGNLARNPGLDDLTVGYHVALFHGLRVREKVPLAGDMAILPSEQWGAFVNERILQDFAPAIIRDNLRESVGALVKPFLWAPKFRQRGDGSVPDLNWGGSFRAEAQAFVEFLALFHTAPVICLATLPYCIHRTASSLLGGSHHNGSYQWGHSARSFDFLAESTELSVDALNEASEAFGYRQSINYQYCAPIVARLAEALARSGRFQIDDKILDVTIALERMYEDERDRGAIGVKLGTRAADFLATNAEDRERVLRDVREFYKVRSAIVHKRKKPPSAAVKEEAFTKGFKVARRSVVKLLQEGSPSDWNTRVIAGTEPSAAKPGDGDGTA